MNTISKQRTTAIAKSVSKAIQRHSITTGLVTGVAAALVLSRTKVAKRVSEAAGERLADLMRKRPTNLLSGLRTRTSDLLSSAGRLFHREANDLEEVELPR